MPMLTDVRRFYSAAAIRPRALDAAVNCVKQRRQLGRPISHNRRTVHACRHGDES
jgi:hypothetical protein